MIVLKNILVPTDFGEASAAALAYGRDLARQYGARLHLLFVDDDIHTRYGLDTAAAFLPAVPGKHEKTAREHVAALLTSDDRRRLRARAVVRTSPSPPWTIVEYARNYEIDLIVMGTHGRQGLPRIFTGSVAERVTQTAPCPVLTVRHPEREFIARDALEAAVNA